LPTYEYNFTPQQLIFLCECLEATRELAGPVVEIGCSSGRTTLFLNKYMDVAGIEKPYYCIDTFAGFTSADVAHEVHARNKRHADYRGLWNDWSKGLFERTMELNGVTRVRAIQADINELDCSALDAPSLCLVDVDLYRPVKTALHKFYPVMEADGGIIVVDDCVHNNKYDGAVQAYHDFVRDHGIWPDLRFGKLGVIDMARIRYQSRPLAAFGR
jgi:hypothetical protein